MTAVATVVALAATAVTTAAVAVAIVAEYKFKNGTVRIDDDCYRDVPPEEMQRRIERVQRTAWELYLKNERRKGNENL